MESPFWQASGLLKYIGSFLSGVCHQLPEHSLFVAGIQMPLCARCMGTYLGALLGLCNLWWRGHVRASQLPPRKMLALLGFFFTFWAIDGLNSYISFLSGKPGMYTSNNFLRLTAGMANGVSLSLLVVPMFNAALWREPEKQHIVNGLGELGILLLQAAVLELLLQADISVLLYPLILANVLSVLLLFTVLNTTILVILLHWEKRAESWRDALFPVGLGLVLSVVEVSVIALLRYVLTLALPVALLFRQLRLHCFSLV